MPETVAALARCMAVQFGQAETRKNAWNKFKCCIFAQTVGLLILTLTAMLYASFR